MKVLPDINILLAYGWQQHPFHASCCAWFDGLSGFALCPITELGFLRISMSSAFRASYEGASQVLDAMKARAGASHLPCDALVGEMPQVSSYKDTTDAYLVHLARCHSYRFATLDDGILNKGWADGVAYNPVAT